jgi:multiple sugar transport system substrate-binding protein
MRSIGGRPGRRRTVIGAATALVLALAACGGGGGGAAAPAAAEVGPDGVDDGATLTLWTRAPLEKQANLLVEAYNASHRNQVELTVVPNDDYVAKVGAAAGADGLPDLLAADIVYVPNWAEQGLFQDITDNVDALAFKDELNQGHMSAGTLDGRAHVLPFVLDLSMLFWNKDLFREAGLYP